MILSGCSTPQNRHELVDATPRDVIFKGQPLFMGLKDAPAAEWTELERKRDKVLNVDISVVSGDFGAMARNQYFVTLTPVNEPVNLDKPERVLVIVRARQSEIPDVTVGESGRLNVNVPGGQITWPSRNGKARLEDKVVEFDTYYKGEKVDFESALK
jgi:hypothetical protein